MDRAPDGPPSSERPAAADLRELGLFGGLGDDALQLFADRLRRIKLAQGDIVYREGDDARELYVVLRGEIELRKHVSPDADVQIATVRSGFSFGEICILDVQRRATTARALVPSRLLVVTVRDLDSLYRQDLKAYTMFILNVARDLCRRLRLASARIAELAAPMPKEDESRA